MSMTLKFEALKRLVPEGLPGVSNKVIWKYWTCTSRMMEAYWIDVAYASAENERFVSGRHKSHRPISQSI